MMKKYIAKSCVSISVSLSTGGTTHISFTPKTGGGSVFYTDNAKLQEGLEKHPKFGKLFKIDNQPATVTKKTSANQKRVEAKPIDTKSDGGKDAGTDGKADDAQKHPIEKEVTCNDDAKDYLADKFGISRSKLRNREQIEAAAATNGVKLIWK